MVYARSLCVSLWASGPVCPQCMSVCLWASGPVCPPSVCVSVCGHLVQCARRLCVSPSVGTWSSVPAVCVSLFVGIWFRVLPLQALEVEEGMSISFFLILRSVFRDKSATSANHSFLSDSGKCLCVC